MIFQRRRDQGMIVEALVEPVELVNMVLFLVATTQTVVPFDVTGARLASVRD